MQASPSKKKIFSKLYAITRSLGALRALTSSLAESQDIGEKLLQENVIGCVAIARLLLPSMIERAGLQYIEYQIENGEH